MARPTQPKDTKPKALEALDEGAPASSKEPNPMLNIIVTVVVIVLSTSLSSAASMYFLAPIIMKPMLSSLAPKGEGEEGGEGEGGAEGEEEHGEGALPSVGPVLALDEFTVNLKDADRERYLRASISLTVTANDPKFGKLAGEEAKKWEEEFHIEMGPYVPAVRDLIISALTKRTAAELSTAVGKEEVKNEVKKGVDALFHGERKVIRVNLENFIIQ